MCVCVWCGVVWCGVVWCGVCVCVCVYVCVWCVVLCCVVCVRLRMSVCVYVLLNEFTFFTITLNRPTNLSETAENNKLTCPAKVRERVNEVAS